MLDGESRTPAPGGQINMSCPAQPSPAPGANVTESSGECQSQQPAATSHHAASHLVPHIKYRSTQILLLKKTPLFLYLISWSYKTIFPYSNIFSWCPHILTQVNVFSNLSKYLMIEYEVALKNTPESIERIDCVLH